MDVPKKKEETKQNKEEQQEEKGNCKANKLNKCILTSSNRMN